jgi:hypothetical protein
MANNHPAENPANPAETTEKAPEKKKWSLMKKVIVAAGGIAALAALPIAAQHMGVDQYLRTHFWDKTADAISSSSEYARKGFSAIGSSFTNWVSNPAQRFGKSIADRTRDVAVPNWGA